jgi:hypothetical protein
MISFRALLIFLLLGSTSISVFCRDCGKKTSDIPVEGTTFMSMTGGTVKSIFGRAYYTYSEIPAQNIIVEVYRNRLSKISLGEEDYKVVAEIISHKRIKARLIEKGGRFCFRSLPAGKYLLRIGMRDDPQFSPMNVFVTVAPKAKQSSRRILRVNLAMSI